jgi:acetolactate synthase regulatory subunit
MNAPAAPLSPYSSALGKSNIEVHTLSVLVDNEPGVLARVVGLFSGRGYNIESLTVAEVAHAEHLSRITIVTSGPPEAIEQIGHQLERLVPIHKVTDLTLRGNAVERELAMIKVVGKGTDRDEALRPRSRALCSSLLAPSARSTSSSTSCGRSVSSKCRAPASPPCRAGQIRCEAASALV